MECRFCKEIMDLINVYDDPNKVIAFNFYSCRCGAIVKESVWKDPGELWIPADNNENLEYIKKEK